MNRRGFSYFEMLVYLAVLALLMPVVSRLTVQALRDEPHDRYAERAALDRACDELRRDAVRGWRVGQAAVLVGDRRWSAGEEAVLRDGYRHLRRCEIRWRRDDRGWLLIELQPAHGTARRITAAPTREPSR